MWGVEVMCSVSPSWMEYRRCLRVVKCGDDVCSVLCGCRVVVVVECCGQGRKVCVDWCRCREVETFEGGLCWVVLRTRDGLGGW
jgi:hypothetical protein